MDPISKDNDKVSRNGSCTVKINSGERLLSVDCGARLLEQLALQEIFIPSACGGRGRCGYCKVRVESEAPAPGQVEERILSSEEIAEGFRLACQITVESDIDIRIPAEHLAIRRYSGRVVSKKMVTHDIVHLRIALDKPGEMDFVAGQYAQLESREYDGHASVMRAFSICSLPVDKRHVEFLVRRVPNGICTGWVFDHLLEGDELRLNGPFGNFYLRPTDAPVLFIAGGSGMAPVWSMLRTMRDAGCKRPIRYVFGALTQADLFFVQELQELEREMNDFRFIPALSNEPEEGGWKGERGFITDVVGRNIPDASRHEAYLCGSPGMINACIKVLRKAGISEDHIYYDKFA